jgi:diguanylate cyclase (GGDEF)-like protein
MSMGSLPGVTHRPVGPGRVRFVRPGHWALWSQPRHVIGYVVLVDLAAIAAVVTSVRWVPFTGSNLAHLLALITFAALYGEASRHIERIRRQYAGTPHIDLNSVWMFAAVVLLHPAYTTAVIVTFYAHRWLRVAHRLVHRAVFNAAAATLSGFAATGVLAATGRFQNFAELPRDVPTFAIIALAAGVFLVVNTILISTAVALSSREPTLRSITADWSDYALEAATLALGAVLAWALADWPIMALPIVGVTLVLHGKVLLRQLKEAARTDAKTGLLNTAAWYDAARREIARTSRHGPHTAILVIDLDHFKVINDQHGHLAGDEILLATARIITSQVRGYDLVGRFGGEEFVVLLPDVDTTTAVRIAERIRENIAAIVLPITTHHGSLIFRGLTASIGIATYPRHGDMLDQLLRAADQALYAAKHAGRNQLQLAADRTSTQPLRHVGGVGAGDERTGK